MSDIPIVIINRDRLTTTKKLVDQLMERGYDNIHIADMDSSYPPLLSWHGGISLPIHHFPNGGQKWIWTEGWLKKEFVNYPFVCVTDSDIELDPRTPKGFIEQMVAVAKDFRIDKVGLSIKFSDISNPILKEIITPIESNYWKVLLPHPNHYVFNAPVDTTLCVVRPELPFQYQALRIADWSIIHTPWYENWDNLTEEELFYMTHADELIATTKQHYLNYLATK